MKRIKRQTQKLSNTDNWYHKLHHLHNKTEEQSELEILSLNVEHLWNELQQIKLFYKNIDQISISNSQSYSLYNLLHLLSMMSLCYPVMVHDIEQVIKIIIPDKGLHLILSTGIEGISSVQLLQVVNIFCMVKYFNLSLLKLNSNILKNLSQYAQALWCNILPILIKQEHYDDIQQYQKKISQQNTKRVIQFINKIEEYKNRILQQCNQNLQYTFAPQFNHYHALNYSLCEHSLVTIDYLPQDFQNKYIQIWIDRSTQLNSLLGNFICKQRFGEFEYVKGPLLYTMQQGIILLLNNFAQISNELLVCLKTLALQGKINYNNRIVWCNSGFKMLAIGTLSGVNKDNYCIAHHQLPVLKVTKQINFISNVKNKQYIHDRLNTHQNQYGRNSTKKLWKRICRLRNIFVSGSNQEISETFQGNQKLWDSYFTQQFKSEVQLQIKDLTNTLDATRIIHYKKIYKKQIIGRTQLSIIKSPSKNIIKTQYSLSILQRLILAQELGESPLLVSQTGCGKTTLVQYLAQISGRNLFIYNMSAGTDVNDLVGGFKPINCKLLLKELLYRFIEKFREDIADSNKNQNYLQQLIVYYEKNMLQLLLKSLVQSIPIILQQITNKNSNNSSKINQWSQMAQKFKNILNNLDRIDSNLVFNFMQGNLIRAIRNGDWLLIDEINLASNQILQKLVPLIEGKSIMIYERGDLQLIIRHKDFRIIACMNPANDSGKKNLPKNLLDKFTIIRLNQPSSEDIKMMVMEITPELNAQKITTLFEKIKCIKTISLRNLTRALNYINCNKYIYSHARAFYDGFMLGFSDKNALKEYQNHISPKSRQGYKLLCGFLLQIGDVNSQPIEQFHLTNTFKEHLSDFLRAITGTRLPVLLEGPTSTGKTSMVRYVAEIGGYRCIRINNHQHTEIEEYIGNYFPDKMGRLVFREGPLVQAVRQGYWIILDELNLAKTQILQCLNRLLDDNRQLFIPQQQKHIKPHKNFRIFATQNPSSYSGRKQLSRAFQNRFITLTFKDINTQDTMTILKSRSLLLNDSNELSIIVESIIDKLRNYRQRQQIFSKENMITIRDLLKWCSRQFISKQMFMLEGYALLAERLRTIQEKEFVRNVLLGNTSDEDKILRNYSAIVNQYLNQELINNSGIYIQLNKSFIKMAALTIKALINGQPVLLVGQTGSGKTTLAQLLAKVTNRVFYSINCHKHLEASDLLGCLRPCNRDQNNACFHFVNGVVLNSIQAGGLLLIDEINTAQNSVLQRLNQLLQNRTLEVQRGQGWQHLCAHRNFNIIATMNPSGDYGKKQLSPALRNRFTQIWVQSITLPTLIKSSQNDIIEIIQNKLRVQGKDSIKRKIYYFIQYYNCQLVSKYNLVHRIITMRDVGWICEFINQSQMQLRYNLQQSLYWALRILSVQSISITLNEQINCLQQIQSQLLELIEKISQVQIRQQDELICLSILLKMKFPILIQTNLPLTLLNITLQQEIFFTQYTDLSDILGQFKPKKNQFIWYDNQLLSAVKKGSTIAMYDLNLAQQTVIEGINSLFDHRGNIFVIQLNQTYYKNSNFLPIVVLKQQQTTQNRKGLPQSFMNRFVKIKIKDVSIQRKINYLIQKYQLIQQQNCGVNYAILQSVLGNIIGKQMLKSISELELFTVLVIKGHIKQAISLLNLNINKSQYENLYREHLKFSNYFQHQILQFLPQKQLKLATSEQIKALLDIYMMIMQTNHSICLVGEKHHQQKMVNNIAYYTRKSITKVLLSTMIDISQLLGSYEQITINNQITDHSNNMSIEQSIFGLQQSNRNDKNKLTQFVYLQSNISKALNNNNTILYIQIPNENLLQKLQKGLSKVYHRQKQILIGLNKIINKEKLVTGIHLYYLTDKLKYYKEINKVNQNEFVTNYTNLKHYDCSIRKQQTIKWILRKIHQSNINTVVEAWQIVLQNLMANNLEQIQSIDIKKVQQQEMQKLQHKYKIKSNQFTSVELQKECQYRQICKQIMVCHNLEQYRKKILLLCLFSHNQNVMNQYLSIFNKEQQILRTIIYKFQVLYYCNLNNFRQKIYQYLLKLIQQKTILQKFYQQLNRLYFELISDKIKQIVIQIDNQSEIQNKILNINLSLETTKYSIMIRRDCQKIPQSIKLIYNGIARISQAYKLTSNIQAIVMNEIENLSINENQIALWINSIKIKDKPSFDLLMNQLQTRNSKYQNIINNMYVQQFLSKLNLLNNDNNNNNNLNYAFMLFNIFKPNNNIHINLSYHLNKEYKLNTNKQLSNKNQSFIKCYQQLNELKYSNYHSKNLQKIQNKLQQIKQQIQNCTKDIIYRNNYDNINELQKFYILLISCTNRIENNNFCQEIIVEVILHHLSQHYTVYSDILLPYFLSLFIILQIKRKQYQERNTQPKGIRIIQEIYQSIPNIIQKIIQNEKQILDQSKEYLIIQKKFNKNVIIDQYTEQGKQKNQKNIEQEFNNLFRKNNSNSQNIQNKQQEILEYLYINLMQPKKCYKWYIIKQYLSKVNNYSQLIISLFFLQNQTSNCSSINIYSQININAIKSITQPLPFILLQIKQILNEYSTENIRKIPILINKIYQHQMFQQQVYKVLTDCQLLIEKIYQVNTTLPSILHINPKILIQKCLAIRRIELHNWKCMFDYKLQRIQKIDLLQCLQIYKISLQLKNNKQSFIIFQKFLRQSKLSCFSLRIKFIKQLLNKRIIIINKQFYYNLYRLIGFYQNLEKELYNYKQQIKKYKIIEMQQYQKLIGWNSNEYLIFKSTCQKFQRKVHSILRKYQQSLSITIGQLHQSIQNKSIHQTIQSFNQYHQNDKINQQHKYNINDLNQQQQQQLQQQQQQEQQQQYKNIIHKIFEIISDLQLQYHNSQSKLLIIRNNLKILQQNIKQWNILNQSFQYKFIILQQFYTIEQYQKTSKYYYGIWDKLCQRKQTIHYFELVNRLWRITELIWIKINYKLPVPKQYKKLCPIKNIFQLLFNQEIIGKNGILNQHQIVLKEIQKINYYCRTNQNVNCQDKQKQSEKIDSKMRTLIKLGYIIASITLNLQENGLCVKQNQSNQQSGTQEEIGQGLGLGQGQVHEAAENIGQQIEFQQQIQGHKDEKQNQSNNAGNKQQDDIQMQGQFDGEMHSKQQDNNEGQQKSIDEEMGSVDNKNRQQDIKNDKGQASGQEQADVDIDGQSVGSSQLVDNQHQDKEKRKKQQRNEGSAQQQRSDWGDNEDQGSKINKQDLKDNMQLEEEEPNSDHSAATISADNEQSPGQNDQKNKQQSNNKNQQNNEGIEKNEHAQQQQDKQMSKEDNKSIQQNPIKENQNEKPMHSKAKNNKYQPSYGRQDINTQDQLQLQQKQNQEIKGSETDGKIGTQILGEQQTTENNPIHNLSAELLQTILQREQQIKSTFNKEKFVKNLNVAINEQKQVIRDEKDDKAKQFEFTKQNEKINTNLPAIIQIQQQINENNKQQQQQQQRQQRQQIKQKQENIIENKIEQKQKQKQKQNKILSNEKKMKIMKQQQNKNKQYNKQQLNQKEIINLKSNIIKQMKKQLNQKQQELIKKTVNILEQQQYIMQQQQNNQILNSQQLINSIYKLSRILQQQLKSVLEPIDNIEYHGDYRTGKKLNLKKIIPFIASNYHKDRIWLRRTQASQRNYYIMIGLDDTKSMYYTGIGQQALKGMLGIAIALQHMNIKIAINGIQDHTILHKQFKDRLNPNKLINNFNFQYESSNSNDLSMAVFMKSSLKQFDKIIEENNFGQNEQHLLCFIISDGKINKEMVKPYIKQANKKGITYVFIVMGTSVLDIKTIDFKDNKMQITNYMNDFPFEYYLIVMNANQLGQVLAMALMQFIQQKI